MDLKIKDYVKAPHGFVDTLIVFNGSRQQTFDFLFEREDSAWFKEYLEKCSKGYAIMAAFPTVRSVPDGMSAEQFHRMNPPSDIEVKRVHAAVAKYKPKCLIVFSIPMMIALDPNLSSKSKAHVHNYVHPINIAGRTLPALCIGSFSNVTLDYLESTMLPQNMTKWKIAAQGKDYCAEGRVIDLNSDKTAKEYLEHLAYEAKGWIACDTETKNLNVTKHNQQLATIQFATSSKDGYVLYWDHEYNKRSKSHDESVIKPLLRKLFTKPDKAKGFIFHNAQFDLAQISNGLDMLIGLDLTVLDNMLLTHMLDQNRSDKQRMARVLYAKEGAYSLKQISAEFIGYYHYDSETLSARRDGSVINLPYDKLTQYAGQDGFVTYRDTDFIFTWAELIGYSNKLMRFAKSLHSRALKSFQYISTTGFMLDENQLKFLHSKDSPIRKEKRDVEAEFAKDEVVKKVNLDILKTKTNASTFWEIPWVFDVSKPMSKNMLFFKSEHGRMYPPNAKGKYSCDDKFQEKYSSDPLVKLLTRFNEADRMMTGFVEASMESLIEAKTNGKDMYDGRAHSRFLLHGTKTGRLSSRGPNLQQIPRADSAIKKPVKCLYVAPRGKVLFQADFAAAEVRMWGSLSEDKFLCKLLQESFKMRADYRANPTDPKLRERAELMADVHRQTASLMFGVDVAGVDKALRTVTKGITFGLIYGRGVKSIAEQLGRSLEETEELCTKFFSQFPEGIAWLSEMKDFCYQHGYVETKFGRRRYMPWVMSNDESLIAGALRQSINTPVQSASGDYATLSISLLQEHLIRHRMLKHFKIVNAVHDSTIIEIPASSDALAEISEATRQAFTIKARAIALEDFRFDIKAPMDVDMEVSQWKGKKCVKCGYEYPIYKSKCSAPIKGPDGKPLKDDDGNEIKCGCEDHTILNLNNGWGTLITLDETAKGYREAAMGF
jgi:DNA polymerase I-like protein with 3'-5' exonuclease and polymerase domains